MNILTETQYNQAQADFIAKHPISQIVTSPMCDNAYSKVYIAEDGSSMWECRRLVFDTVYVEVRGTKMNVDVKLWEYECWSTEFKSMYFYEKA